MAINRSIAYRMALHNGDCHDVNSTMIEERASVHQTLRRYVMGDPLNVNDEYMFLYTYMPAVLHATSSQIYLWTHVMLLFLYR